MTKCEHWDCGWCNAPDDVKTNALGSGVCNLPEYCPYLKSQNQMNEIEKTEGEIKVLQAKVKFLKEIENHKSSVEEAYKRVYGWYPPTTPSVSNYEDNSVWSAFQKGYNASKEDCKVEEEPEPMDDVIDRLLEEYKSQKLWNMVRNELGYSVDCCDEIVDLVERWIPEPQNASGSQNVYVECTVEGFNDAINKIQSKLR